MNTPMENRTFQSDKKKKILKIAIIVVLAFAIIANGIQGYLMYKKTKAYRVLDSIIQNKSNCDKCPEPAQAETPVTTEPTTTTPTTTTPKSKSKPKSSTPSTDTSSGSSSGSGTIPETVIPPPPPPSD
jgi:flagellar basal body-associated protein FliL